MKTFTEWSLSQTSEGRELATNSRTKKERDRDRLTRMESLLHELVKTKQIISRSADHAQE
jgi:hypothetical protein